MNSMFLLPILASASVLDRSPTNSKDSTVTCNEYIETHPNLHVVFGDSTGWASAGVIQNANYFCIKNVTLWIGEGPVSEFVYLVQLANRTTSPNDSVAVDNCVIKAGQCTDAALRQQIIESGICKANRTPQQYVDLLMLTLNRPGWLYLAVYGIDDYVQIADDNTCTINLPNYMVIEAAKIDIR